MAKIRVLIYKTPWKLKWKYVLNWIISIRTFSKYSHVEGCTADGEGLFDKQHSIGYDSTHRHLGYCGKDYLGTCYTSTMRGKDNGSVKRDASEVLKHPENWDYIEVDIPDQCDYDRAIEYLVYEVANNKGYSKWDTLKFISPIHFPDNLRNICSEIVNNALWMARVFVGFGIISPGAVAKKLTKKGLKIQSLI